MKTSTLLNIYQSYTLTKVSELNKQSLVAQYAQNEQLNKLNQELARANRTSELILRNQIKEIERQEKRHYFKSLTFNLSQAMTLLENEENVNFRIFASGLFLSPICDLARNAVQELDEISDKEYAQNIVKRAQILSADDDNIESYKESSWAHLLPTKSKIDSCITEKIKEKKKKIRLKTTIQEKMHEKEEAREGCFGCLLSLIILHLIGIAGTIYTHDYDATKGCIILLIPALLVLLVTYTKKNENRFKQSGNEKVSSDEMIKDSLEDILKNEIAVLSDELANLQQEEIKLNTQYNELLQDITADCPKWENKLSEIASFIPHEEKDEHKDPLLSEAAKLIVKTNNASVSLIQRKFAIGYNRAGEIMNQLEDLGIVGPAIGKKTRMLLCKSEEELSELLK